MIFNDDNRQQIQITVTTDLDPAAATLVLKIGGVAYPCTWTAAAEVSGSTWTRKAHTTAYFAGPAVAGGVLAGATVLALGGYTTEVVVSNAGTIISARTETLSVRSL